VNKQWLQIVAIWVATLIFGLLALANFKGDQLYTVFAAIAAGAIALVSIEHLISAKAKDTIRQQVYVSAGTMTILATLTLVSFAG
jgi:predicted membrane channel-forming protein YqfA (hemolysin III family)